MKKNRGEPTRTHIRYIIKASKSRRESKISRLRDVIWSPLSLAARSESISHLAFEAALRITSRDHLQPRHTSTEDINNANSKLSLCLEVFLLPSSCLVPPPSSCFFLLLPFCSSFFYIFCSARQMARKALNFTREVTNGHCERATKYERIQSKIANFKKEIIGISGG